MPANFLHGVETIQITTGARPITGVKSAVIGIIGTAPIFDCATADQTKNVPVQILSATDAAKYAGKDRTGFTIPQALDAIFTQGNGPIVIMINILDPAVHKTNVASEVKALGSDDKLTLAHPGVASVVVKNQAGTTTYVLNTDYTLDAANGVITRITTGTITAGQTLNIAYDWADPSKVLAADIIGTTDASGNRTGLKAFQDCYAKFGFYPKMLIAPGFSTLTGVLTEMDSIAAKVRAMALVDFASGTTVSQAITARGAGGSMNTSSKRVLPCYPYVKRLNPSTNVEELVPYSSYVAGAIAAKDNDKGYWWSPSNTEIKGITGVERQLTAVVNDPNSEVNQLNSNGIMTVFNSFGTGFRTWGNRSAAYPTYTTPDNFICVQRTADIIHESVEYAMLQFLDFPINNALIDSVTESVNSFIRTLIGRGALIDGKCIYDPAKNPATEISAGHLTFNLEFMPPVPAERITFESYININLLKKLAGGQ